MTTRYGVISGIHKNPRIIIPAIHLLKAEGAEKLILNGDIGKQSPTLRESQNHIASIIETAAKSGLETFVQPGSNETVEAYRAVLEYYTKKYGNIIDTIKEPKREEEDHDLIFIPGSDWISGGEYHLGTEEVGTGYFKGPGMPRHLKDLGDIRRNTTRPKQTIAISYIPRRFKKKGAVDEAYFAEQKDGNIVPGILLEQQLQKEHGTLTPEELQEKAKEKGYTLKRENRGNTDLRRIYEEAEITKAISGHFPEAGGRAHDELVRTLPPEELHEELYWNSGQLDQGFLGILSVQENKAGYKNLRLS